MMPLISTALALFSLGAPVREVRPALGAKDR